MLCSNIFERQTSEISLYSADSIATDIYSEQTVSKVYDYVQYNKYCTNSTYWAINIFSYSCLISRMLIEFISNKLNHET